MGWRLAVIALAVVVAGCGSVTEADTATDTVTPAPVPTVSEAETDAGNTLPPGVTGGGVVDPGALVAAHVAEIRDRSYTLRVRVRSDTRRADRVVRVETPTRYYRRDSFLRPNRTITKFADGTHLYTNVSRNSFTRYARTNASGFEAGPTVRLAGVFLGVDNVTVAETSVDGQLRYAIEGSFDAHPRVDSLENYSVRAVVTPEGFIRSMNVSYRRHEDVPRTTVVRSFEYSDVGTTQVERPAWVTENWNGTGD